MRKERFVYNTKTLRYEKEVVPIKVHLVRMSAFLLAVVLAAVVMMSVRVNFFPSPKELALERELEQMEYKYTALNNQVGLMSQVLDNIQERDASVHRMLFGMEPIDSDVWNGGTGGHDQYANLTKYQNTGDLLIATQEKVDRLKNQMAVQSQSLDKIQDLAKDKEKLLSSMPAIKPIRSDKLKRNIRSLSGFGWRIHPIFKKRKMHTGIDFTCPKGTPIIATGDGKVLKVEKRKSGYGKCVTIDHGFGYQTKYAHMSAIDVKRGQKVTRGQVIGKVGNTGTSTAPHLHYEVIYKGKKVDPIHYCMDGLSPKEYQELVQAASVANQSFD